MDDIRYDQYGGGVNYPMMDKQQPSYQGRPVPPRYGNMPMGMMNQNRMSNQQQMNMMEQQRKAPGMNQVMGERNMAMNDVDNGYGYNMPMNARNGAYGMNIRNSMGMEGMEGRHYAGPGPAMQKQMPQSAYMRAESREIDDANVYRYYQNMCTQRMDSIRKPFYSIPSSFIFPTPSISEDQIKSFSNTLLFYIFYLMPNDRLQILVAIELYDRKFVYHKERRSWYRKSSLNGATCKCNEVFDLKSNCFVSVDEEFRNNDFLTLSNLKDCLKQGVN